MASKQATRQSRFVIKFEGEEPTAYWMKLETGSTLKDLRLILCRDYDPSNSFSFLYKDRPIMSNQENQWTTDEIADGNAIELRRTHLTVSNNAASVQRHMLKVP